MRLPARLRHKKLQHHLPQVVGLLLLLGLIASIVYWGRFFLKRDGNEPEQQIEMAAEAELSQAAVLFGEEASMGASHYQLLGIVVGKRPEDGIAILGEDGKPGKPVRVGKEITSGVSVKEVGPGYALLSDNGRTVRLMLPERAAKPSAQERAERRSDEED